MTKQEFNELYEQAKRERREKERREKTAFRNQLAQLYFDYYIYHNNAMSDTDLRNRLYNNNFTQGEATRAIEFIKNQFRKALSE